MSLDDQKAFEIALAENLQSRSLSPIEEAEAFKSYVTNFGRGSVSRLARKIGKSEAYVSHRLLLLGLPKALTDKISRRLLDPSIATELIWLKSEKSQVELARAVSDFHLSFRQIRDIIHLIRTEDTSVDKAVEMILQTREDKMVAHRSSEPTREQSISEDPWPAYQDTTNDDSQSQEILGHATLVVRTSLAGLDILLEKTNQSEIYAVLTKERQNIHGVLDDLIRAKISFRKRENTSLRSG
jgi:ParB family chromosome partitioning protein